jgi:predicted metallo-beta-lactamase superfamily hydrolase
MQVREQKVTSQTDQITALVEVINVKEKILENLRNELLYANKQMNYVQ